MSLTSPNNCWTYCFNSHVTSTVDSCDFARLDGECTSELLRLGWAFFGIDTDDGDLSSWADFRWIGLYLSNWCSPRATEDRIRLCRSRWGRGGILYHLQDLLSGAYWTSESMKTWSSLWSVWYFVRERPQCAGRKRNRSCSKNHQWCRYCQVWCPNGRSLPSVVCEVRKGFARPYLSPWAWTLSILLQIGFPYTATRPSLDRFHNGTWVALLDPHWLRMQSLEVRGGLRSSVDFDEVRFAIALPAPS